MLITEVIFYHSYYAFLGSHPVVASALLADLGYLMKTA